jgi:subtilisin family serine protease
VAWLGGPPARRDDLACRRPVVAVLDTGVGEHPWLPLGQGSCVHRNVTVGKTALGLNDPIGSEVSGVVSDPLEGVLDPYSGHGTFIAGLIRQQCPDADILSVRVVPSEGAVPEHVLLDALGLLVVRQAAAQNSGSGEEIVDVVCLSLGYYPEHVDLMTAHPFLFDPIDALTRRGVAVVASAGNDATNRPMYPAAFTPHAGGIVPAPDPDSAPVISVGASNPDGSIALFSNAGPWVTCIEPGAAVVSTFPAFDASGEAAYGFEGSDGRRATVDPDNFSGGFGVWSGTSFAAPVLAGKLAQSLVNGDCGDVDSVDPESMLDRAWAAIAANTPVSKP